MLRYTIKRLILALLTLLGITFVTFLMIRVAPGDPALAAMSRAGPAGMSAGTYARLREHYGLDAPAWRQYGRWLGQVARLDFGRSFHDRRPVAAKIADRLPATLALASGAIMLSLVVSIPLALRCAARRDGPFDTVVGVLLYGSYAIPRYVMAMLLITVVGVQLEWLPPFGMTSEGFESLSWPGQLADLARHFVLILLCFSYPLVAYQTRFLRGTLLDVMQEDYIRTARAKGLPESVVLRRHALPNALIPLITLIGLLVPSVIGGSVILETMFDWPGVGRLFYQAMTQRDYPVVMALTTVSAVVVLASTLAADLACAIVDPRVRHE